jgi:hypothetical protein
MIDYSIMRPHITDRQSLRGYIEIGYRLVEDDPHWLLYAPDEALYATVDRALAEMIMQFA